MDIFIVTELIEQKPCSRVFASEGAALDIAAKMAAENLCSPDYSETDREEHAAGFREQLANDGSVREGDYEVWVSSDELTLPVGVIIDPLRAEIIQIIDGHLDGTSAKGRWLDTRGHECQPDDLGARWEEYTEEEQSLWLDTLADMLREIRNKLIGIKP